MSAGYLNVRAATLLRRLDIKLRACWRPLTMKKLLLLALIAVAREATAEDAKCVREHAAMIETIRAYARSDAGLLGPQGISESVLEAMGQTEPHRLIPGGSCSVAYADRPVSIGQDQT